MGKTPGGRKSDHVFSLYDDGKLPNPDKPGAKMPAGVAGVADCGQKGVGLIVDLLNYSPTDFGKFAGTGLSINGESTLERTASHEFGHTVFGRGHSDEPCNLMQQSVGSQPGTDLNRNQLDFMMQTIEKIQNGSLQSKDNFMISNKYLQLSISFLVIILLWSCNPSKRISSLIYKATRDDASQLLLQFDFQKNFDKDTISLSIEDNVISSRIILTSMDIVDFTMFRIYIIKEANDNILAVYNGKRNDNGMDFYGRSKIGSIKRNLKLSCKVNGHESVKDLDIGNGKFVGISKSEKDSIVICQREKQFQYD